jgi:hypothetical protein
MRSTYHLGRSQVTDSMIDEFVHQGLIDTLLRSYCRAPGMEEVPRPESYEVVVFWDFFVAGFRFPCEDFIGGVLQHFRLQFHHLTPNAFTRLGLSPRP